METTVGFYCSYNSLIILILLIPHLDPGSRLRWDEWLTVDRLLRDTPEARQLMTSVTSRAQEVMRNIQQQQQHSKKGSSSKTPFFNDASAPILGPVKMMVDPQTVEDEESGYSEIRFPLPQSIRRLIVADWSYVARDQKHYALPLRPTTRQIFDEYLLEKESQAKRSAAAPPPSHTFFSNGVATLNGPGPYSNNLQNAGQLEEAALAPYRALISSLRQYFDRALPNVLLYYNERVLWNNIAESSLTGSQEIPHPQDLYGFPYLLRLLVRLPHFISQTALSTEELEQLTAKLRDFIRS